MSSNMYHGTLISIVIKKPFLGFILQSNVFQFFWLNKKDVIVTRRDLQLCKVPVIMCLPKMFRWANISVASRVASQKCASHYLSSEYWWKVILCDFVKIGTSWFLKLCEFDHNFYKTKIWYILSAFINELESTKTTSLLNFLKLSLSKNAQYKTKEINTDPFTKIGYLA